MSSKGYSLRDIAKVLKRSVSTLSEEISRNRTKKGYDSSKAHHKSYVRRKYSKFQGMKVVDNKKLKSFVDNLLYDDQSPGAISGRLKHQEKKFFYVSKDSIYRYIKSIHGRRIESFRKHQKRKRRKTHRKKTHLTDRKFIDKRPKYVQIRKRTGDAEADFIESGRSGKGIILVVEDLKTRTTFLERIISINIPAVHNAFVRIKKRYPELKTITADNDLLFQKHKNLERLLGVKIYFCHPYRFWEKPSIENTNMYIRKYIPKGSNISSYSRSFIEKLEQKLNRRILACLKFRTPLETLKEVRKKKKRQKHRRFA